MNKLKVVFFGTPDFSVPTLDLLYNHPLIDLKYVITMPDRKSGRGQVLQPPPVAQYAKEKKIPLFQTENINKEPEFLDELDKLEVDFALVLAFAQFLGKRVLSFPKQGCFNIHTSILPKYRGAAPIQYALLNGDSSTGVSIQKMVKKMDAGELVHFNELTIPDYENGGLLYTRLRYLAALSTHEFIDKILNNALEFTTQNEDEVTFAPTLEKNDGLIDFENKTSDEIINQIRALDPWPSTFCYLGKKRLKIFIAQKDYEKLSPGAVKTSNNFIQVGTKSGSLRLLEVQLEGKKRCSDIELLNGLKNSKTEFVLSKEPLA